ncbi:SDR family NAD(P)-dependent oxidoreductase [Arthrobacter sp. ATA002]|uniref:SDR family NAD(P)-dependent oxidoreductase n=1 Tax=Arthrobacter sp. ATA002 TaxID=2991715 RepID=UPI0022A7916A|nr:SDR family NAD(P)-dependent oxidoreductase [Arthrobacter sp. ATA002]WAP52457.1 SDR family NAD(P)-dependent oxidoreductase [Arthrobacter sp. ATA002]
MQLAGNTAIITGGSKGIGYAVAGYLMSHGADVVITSRTVAEVQEAAAKLSAAHPGRRALPVVADTAVAADVERMYATAEEKLGPVAVAANVAGNYSLGEIADLSEADWNAVLATHLTGTFLSTREAIRRMRTSGTAGAIVNIGAVDVYGTTRGNAHYAAAKAGILKFTEAAALEAGRYGIRVNSVSPGVVPPAPGDGVLPDTLTKAFHRTFAVDRMGEPSDIGKAVVFLASDYASWITGVDLLVDGGTHLRGLPDYADHLLGGSS